MRNSSFVLLYQKNNTSYIPWNHFKIIGEFLTALEITGLVSSTTRNIFDIFKPEVRYYVCSSTNFYHYLHLHFSSKPSRDFVSCLAVVSDMEPIGVFKEER